MVLVLAPDWVETFQRVAKVLTCGGNRSGERALQQGKKKIKDSVANLQSTILAPSTFSRQRYMGKRISTAIKEH